MKIEFLPQPSLMLNAYVAYGRTFSALAYNASVPLSPSSPISSGGTFHLKSRPWWAVGLGLDWNFIKHWHINLGLDYIYFEYGCSPLVNDDAYESDSTTKYLTAYFGMAYDFADDSKQTSSTIKNSIAQTLHEAAVLFQHRYINSVSKTDSGAPGNFMSPGTYKGFMPGVQINWIQAFHHFVWSVNANYDTGGVNFKSNFAPNFSTNKAHSSHYQGAHWCWVCISAIKEFGFTSTVDFWLSS